MQPRFKANQNRSQQHQVRGVTTKAKIKQVEILTKANTYIYDHTCMQCTTNTNGTASTVRTIRIYMNQITKQCTQWLGLQISTHEQDPSGYTMEQQYECNELVRASQN